MYLLNMIDQIKFLELFREQFVEADAPKIQMGTAFKALDSWDSLTAMAVLATIKDTCGIDLPTDVFNACTTVQDVYDCVENKLTNG